jgi:uncharacterized damage-inducible protein DinB
MLQTALIEIFERDLLKLKEEIGLYKNESDIWVIKGSIANSAGNLCLHLIGNLNHFIGAVLGNSGYVRDRAGEFARKDVTRDELISKIDETITIIKNTLANLSEGDFNKDFPVPKHDRIVKTDFMLLHLLTHFNYHLGQVNYHRRLVSAFD